MITYHFILNQDLSVPLLYYVARAVILCLFFVVLTTAAWIDGKTRTIPDKLVLAVLGISLISIPFFPEIGLPDRLLGLCSED